MDPVTVTKAAQILSTALRSRTVRAVIVGCVAINVAALVAWMVLPGMFIAGLAGQAAKWQQQGSGLDGCDTPQQGLPVPDAPDEAYRGLSKEQTSNARTIWAVAQKMGLGDRAGVIGIATAMQESTLRNIGYGDRDSVGLFQQRAGWGSRATRMNPVRSAGLFFRALARVPGWQRMPLTVAAQRVQRSAFPTAYAKHESVAAGLVGLFASSDRDPAAGLGKIGLNLGPVLLNGICAPNGGETANCPASGLPVEQGLTPDALRVLRCARNRWPRIASFGGVGDRPANVDRDHQEGRAVDIMIRDYRSASGAALGQQIASWARREAPRLGVKYVIWQAKIWSVQRGSEGWRACGSARASCYSGADDTAAHRDHVHVSVWGNRGGQTGTGGGSGRLVLPVVSYTLTARFGQCSSLWARCHTGLDFAAPTGRPVRAIEDGTVTFAGRGGRYGNLTKVSHGNGTASWYAHQSRIRVQKGQRVRAGQAIGAVGATGNVTGPHLHLEIRVRGRAVDPDAWLSARGIKP